MAGNAFYDGEGVCALVAGLGDGLARGLLCSGLLGGGSDLVGVRDVLAEAAGRARAGIVQVGIMCGLNKRAGEPLRRRKKSPGGNDEANRAYSHRPAAEVRHPTQ